MNYCDNPNEGMGDEWDIKIAEIALLTETEELNPKNQKYYLMKPMETSFTLEKPKLKCASVEIDQLSHQVCDRIHTAQD